MLSCCSVLAFVSYNLSAVGIFLLYLLILIIFHRFYLASEQDTVKTRNEQIQAGMICKHIYVLRFVCQVENRLTFTTVVVL